MGCELIHFRYDKNTNPATLKQDLTALEMLTLVPDSAIADSDVAQCRWERRSTFDGTYSPEAGSGRLRAVVPRWRQSSKTGDLRAGGQGCDVPLDCERKP